MLAFTHLKYQFYKFESENNPSKKCHSKANVDKSSLWNLEIDFFTSKAYKGRAFMIRKMKKKKRSIKELFVHSLCRIFNLQQRLFRRFLKLQNVKKRCVRYGMKIQTDTLLSGFGYDAA